APEGDEHSPGGCDHHEVIATVAVEIERRADYAPHGSAHDSSASDTGRPCLPRHVGGRETVRRARPRALLELCEQVPGGGGRRVAVREVVGLLRRTLIGDRDG